MLRTLKTACVRVTVGATTDSTTARRRLVIPSGVVSKREKVLRYDTGDINARTQGLQPVPIPRLDPRTGAPVAKTEEELKASRPSGVDHMERGLPLGARKLIAEVEAEVGSSKNKPWFQLIGKVASNKAVQAPLSDTVINGHDSGAEHSGRVGSRMLQRKRRPIDASVTEEEDARPIEPRAEVSIALENQIAATIEAADVPMLERGHRLVELLGRAYDGDLQLAETTCDAIAAVWFATLDASKTLSRMRGSAASIAIEGGSSSGDPEALEEARRQEAVTTLQHTTLSGEDGVAIDAWPFHEHMLRLYFWMRGGYTAPQPTFVERLMVSTAALAAVNGPSNRLMHVAMRLLSDCDRYAVTPTRVGLAAFFDVCAVHGQMDVALWRFADAQDQLYIAPDSQMCTAVLTGLTKNNLINEAVSFLARIEGVATDTTLLNASLEPLALSDEPLAAFAAYDAAVRQGDVKPTSETFLRLLTACQRLEQWDRARFVLSEMQAHRVKGDATTLNMLLKGLLLGGMPTYARVLLGAMRRKRVDVWPEIADAAAAARVMKSTDAADQPARLSKQQRDRLIAAQPPSAKTSEAAVPGTGRRRRERETQLVTSAAAEQRLMAVDPDVLQRFLVDRGVVDGSDVIARARLRPRSEGHEKLARRVHKELYGVWPPRAALSGGKRKSIQPKARLH